MPSRALGVVEPGVSGVGDEAGGTGFVCFRGRHEGEGGFDEGAAFAAAVGALQFHPLPEGEDAEEVFVGDGDAVLALGDHLAELSEFLLEAVLHGSGDHVRRAGFVDETVDGTLESANEGVEGVPEIGIHRALDVHGRDQEKAAGDDRQFLVAVHERLSEFDFGVGDGGGIDGREFFVEPGLAEEFAVEGAVDGFFASGAAAGGTDVVAVGGAEASGSAGLTNGAEGFGRHERRPKGISYHPGDEEY